MLDHNARILIVDDMRLVRNAIKRYLNSLCYDNVIEAENGASGSQEIQGNQIALNFMDMGMPNMAGLEALKKIREEDNEALEILLIRNGSQRIHIPNTLTLETEPQCWISSPTCVT